MLENLRIRWLLPASVVFLCVMVWLYTAFTAEDAFIVARYAENLVNHGVLEYNLGEPISALTSPSHALILALLLYAINAHTILSYKLLSVLGVLRMMGLDRCPVLEASAGAVSLLPDSHLPTNCALDFRRFRDAFTAVPDYHTNLGVL